MKKTVLWSLVLGLFVAAPASVFAAEEGDKPKAKSEKLAGLSRVCSDALRKAKGDTTGEVCTDALNAWKEKKECLYKPGKGKTKNKGSTPEKYDEDFTNAVAQVCAATEAVEESKSAEGEEDKPKKRKKPKGDEEK